MVKRVVDSAPARLLLDSIFTFALFSALTGFVEATYSFGLMGTDIPPEIVYVLFLLSPFILLIFPRVVDRRFFALVTCSLGFASWMAGLPLGTRWRMLAGGIGCGSFLLFLACRIRGTKRSPWEYAASLGSGVILSIAFRAFHSGNLLLDDGFSFTACAVLSCAAVILVFFQDREKAEEPAAPPRKHRSWRTLGMSLGLFGASILLYFGFTSPVVLSRWGGVSYPAVLVVEAGALILFLSLWLGVRGFRALLSPGILTVWSLLFTAALAAELWLMQPRFGADTIYPLYAFEPGTLGRAVFWIMLALHPVIYADIAFLAHGLHEERPTPRGFVRGFAFGSLFLLLLIFSQIFTTVYDYIPVVGAWFRDKFWMVVCIPGIPPAISILLGKLVSSREGVTQRSRPFWVFGMTLVAAGAVLAAGLTGALPPEVRAKTTLRVLTYNLQQGYGKNGEKSLRLQMETIRRMQPDILGLQETDAARVAGGNSDIVRFLADGMDMYSYYGPAPESGTFGIALLSRYPVLNPRTFFMPSRGEQTAAIDAEIQVDGKQFHVLVTHLDNDGALPQQRSVVDRAAYGTTKSATALVLGDFNFKTTTEQYRVTTSVLEDAWIESAERVVEPGAPDPAGRIDHIFLSPNTRVIRAEYLPEGPSDHPAMFAEIGL